MSVRPFPARSPAGEERFNALIERYGRALRAAVLKVCPRNVGVHVDEVEQDARIRLWNALAPEREIDDPTSYLYRVAATAAIDALRRVKTRREDAIDPEMEDRSWSLATPASASPEHAAIRSEVAEKVRAAVATLPDNRRRAVGLHLQGFTSREIADLLGWSEPKARNLTYRGLATIRDTLEADGIDGVNL